MIREPADVVGRAIGCALYLGIITDDEADATCDTVAMLYTVDEPIDFERLALGAYSAFRLALRLRTNDERSEWSALSPALRAAWTEALREAACHAGRRIAFERQKILTEERDAARHNAFCHKCNTPPLGCADATVRGLLEADIARLFASLDEARESLRADREASHVVIAGLRAQIAELSR